MTAALHSPTMRCWRRSTCAAGKSHINTRLPVRYTRKGGLGPDSGVVMMLLLPVLVLLLLLIILVSGCKRWDIRSTR